MSIDKIPLLTAHECTQISKKIDLLQAHWTHRHHVMPFYTLGAASYLDLNPESSAQDSTYLTLAAQMNPVLKQHFSALYTLLIEKLSTFLNQPVYLAERFAVPGFHIFHYHQEFKQPISSIHQDRQHIHLSWKHPECMQMDQVVSFTLPIELPRHGGGLNYWPKLKNNIPIFMTNQTFIQKNPPEYVPYQIGELVIHSGQMFHQIAMMPQLNKEDKRITLQGHLIMQRLPSQTCYIAYF